MTINVTVQKSMLNQLFVEHAATRDEWVVTAVHPDGRYIGGSYPDEDTARWQGELWAGDFDTWHQHYANSDM